MTIVIDNLIGKAKETLRKLTFNDEFELEDRPSDMNREICNVLTTIGAIRTVSGTNRIYLRPSLVEKDQLGMLLDKLGITLHSIYDKLYQSPEQTLSRSEVVRIIQDNNDEEEFYSTFVSLLSSLDLVTSAGKGRNGGIKIYNREQDQEEIEHAEQKLAQQKQQEIPDTERIRTEKITEASLYPSAEKLLTDLGYQPSITGFNRRLPGEWNTPDVIGYKITRFESIGGAEIEVVTVEVKWRLSKSAIAETMSHQKLSHQSYLMVHQPFDETIQSYLPELMDKGIGLICKSEDTYRIYLPASRNHTHTKSINDFLGVILEKTELESIRKEIAEYIYTDYLKLLFPS